MNQGKGGGGRGGSSDKSKKRGAGRGGVWIAPINQGKGGERRCCKKAGHIG